jgi:hypothetical protein
MSSISSRRKGDVEVFSIKAFVPKIIYIFGLIFKPCGARGIGILDACNGPLYIVSMVMC